MTLQVQSRLPGKQLGQLRPANTTAVSIYTPSGTFMRGEITAIFITNTGSGTAAYSLFHDEDGTTYDETTAIAWDVDITAKGAVQILDHIEIWLSGKSGGNLAVKTDSANDLTFTVYGTEDKI